MSRPEVAWAPGDTPPPRPPIRVIKGKKNKATPAVQIIGVKDANLYNKSDGGSITETIFDTLTRADSAHILLTNATGAAVHLTDCWIRGKVVKKVGGDCGYSHDKFVNYEAIAKDGESKFELGNDFICTLAQVNRLADYHWKYNKTKKHMYSVTLPGFQSFFEPGEWYELQIGAAGTAEYIDSTVECYSVRCSYSAQGSMNTDVTFREVEENWKLDSNEVARYLASGGHTRNAQTQVVTIAAGDYGGYADYYCPGTSDDAAVIQDAIDKTTGGTLQFTAGQFEIYSQVNASKSDVSYRGQGSQTVLYHHADGSTGCMIVFGCTDVILSTTEYKENIAVSDIHFKGSSSDAIQFATVYLYGVRNALFESNLIDNFKVHGIFGNHIAFSNVQNNKIDGSSVGEYGIVSAGYQVKTNFIGNEILNLSSTSVNGTVGMSVGGSNCVAAYNYIHDLATPATTAANGAIYGLYLSGADCIAKSNNVDTIESTGGTTANYALIVTGARHIIDGNKIQNNDNVGLYLTTGATNTKLNNNYCFNNGSDTGLANTNQDNFLDQGVDTQVG